MTMNCDNFSYSVDTSVFICYTLLFTLLFMSCFEFFRLLLLLLCSNSVNVYSILGTTVDNTLLILTIFMLGVFR